MFLDALFSRETSSGFRDGEPSFMDIDNAPCESYVWAATRVAPVT